MLDQITLLERIERATDLNLAANMTEFHNFVNRVENEYDLMTRANLRASG